MSDIHSLPGVTEAKAKSVIRQHRKASFYVKKYLMIFVGALIAAIGLELFLIPNNVIDGGVVGISIMMSSITGLSLGVFLVLLNIPFLYLGYKQIGKNFAIATTIAIVIITIAMTIAIATNKLNYSIRLQARFRACFSFSFLS